MFGVQGDNLKFGRECYGELADCGHWGWIHQGEGIWPRLESEAGQEQSVNVVGGEVGEEVNASTLHSGPVKPWV